MCHALTIGLVAIILVTPVTFAQDSTVKIALLKYAGGGDWYANPTALPNLIKFCNDQLKTNIDADPVVVEAGSRELFNYPLVHMTGHGNVILSDLEIENLRKYLQAGGFLHIDDNYGLDPYVRRELKKLFPDNPLIELPPSHPIFQSPYKFQDGLPKIHEHDNKRPQAFGLFIKGRMVCLYTYESDLGDGWEDPAVHNDSQATRLKALRMGANMVNFVFVKR